MALRVAPYRLAGKAQQLALLHFRAGDQGRHTDAEGAGKAAQHGGGRAAFATLDFMDHRPRGAGPFGEVVQRPAAGLALDADARADALIEVVFYSIHNVTL